MTTTTNPTSSGNGEPRPSFRFHPKLWLAAGLVLAVPAAAMQFTAQVNWGAEDFAVFALMLAVLCAAIEMATNYLTALRWRISAVTLAVLLFLTLWTHLAVGIFD